MRKSPWIGTLFLAAAGLQGDSGFVGGLVSGVVFDAPNRSLRPILGMPGAAYLGAPTARGFDAVSVAPDGRRALAAAQGRLYWFEDVLAGESVRELARDTGGLELAAWKRDSSLAAAWLGGRLFLASTEGRLVHMDLEGLEGTIRALAVTDQGAVLAAVAGVGVYRIEEGAPPALLAPIADPVSLAAAGDRAWVADRARQEVLEIRGLREGSEILLFAGASQGLADPVAVAVSRRGAALWVADAAARKVTGFDLASGARLAEFAVDFEPSRLEELGDAGFLLNERRRAGEPLEVLADGDAPGVYFVPAPALGED